jgi:signal peptide peptidase SppA
LDVDSPGGETQGVEELADKLYGYRDRKPIEASVNSEMASAAFWIGSAASAINITPSGWIGSVGVYMAHTDWSAANEQLGAKVTYISAGPYKVEGHPDAPLTDEAIAHYQSQVDAIYEQFLAALARNRGTSKADVRSNYGGGRMVMATDAKAAGMVDRIETLEQTIARMSGASRAKRAAKAKAEAEKIRNLLS